MSDSLYSSREEQNNQSFDRLAQTLHQFRTTVNDDIHGAIQQENSILDALNDNFSKLSHSVRRTSGNLKTVINRNASLSKIVGIILAGFVIIWMLMKLR